MIAKVHRLIPFAAIAKLLIAVSVVLQLSVILYSHWTGYYNVTGVGDLLFRITKGVSLTFLASLMLAYPNIYLISTLNNKLPWNSYTIRRAFLELAYAIVWASIIAIAASLISHLLNRYQEPLAEVLFNNVLIFAVANILLIVIFEAWLFFNESTQSKKQAKRLEEEVMRVQFSLLKKQLNPHFMFNSLNVLTGLIEEDPKKAQEFTTEFSHLYRYVLAVIEQAVVTLERELSFARSYVYLQQMRYGSALHFDVEIPAERLNRYLPPLALQVVLENAIKHNIISEDKPLFIRAICKGKGIEIRNNIQPKNERRHEPGIGQQNLTQQYELVGNEKPTFTITAQEYVVYLPLIEEEA